MSFEIGQQVLFHFFFVTPSDEIINSGYVLVNFLLIFAKEIMRKK